MHILPVLAGLEVLVLGGGADIFFFVHLNCASNPAWVLGPFCRQNSSPTSSLALAGVTLPKPFASCESALQRTA